MGNMMIQSSLFDFADVTESAGAVEHAPGTWSETVYHTYEEYEHMLREAEQGICALPMLLRLVYAQGIEVFRDNLPVKRVAGPAFCRPASVAVTAASFEEILALASVPVAGIEVKQVKTGLGVKIGVHVAGVGSLLIRQEVLPVPSMSAYFTLGRDRIFLASYMDTAMAYELPAQIFKAAMSAHLIGGVDGKPVNVRTFEYGGREYVTTQLVYRGAYCEGRAWRVASLADYHGQTYTHAGLLDAYNAGTIERGDHRGLVVMVRGQVCVLCTCAQFYDLNGGGVTTEDGVADVDLEIEDQMDEGDGE